MKMHCVAFFAAILIVEAHAADRDENNNARPPDPRERAITIVHLRGGEYSYNGVCRVRSGGRTSTMTTASIWKHCPNSNGWISPTRRSPMPDSCT